MSAQSMINQAGFIEPYPLDPQILRARLEEPAAPVRMVLDTDTFNEIDDQFALAYALRSPGELSIEAVYAAPFLNHRSTSPVDGMERSFEEIGRVHASLGLPAGGVVYRGSRQFIADCRQPPASDAADDLVRRAMASDGPLYVVAIGAPTNVASAILTRPEIVERIVVVWLGSHPRHCGSTREFNLRQDILASRVLFDSGVPLVLVPCRQVAELLRTTPAEVERWLKGKSAIGDYLCRIFAEFSPDHFGWSRSIWDVAAVAWLVASSWFDSVIAPSPAFDNDFCWLPEDPSRHSVRIISYLRRDPIFKDLFRKLAH